MAMTQADYLSQLRALLPPGIAWQTEGETYLDALLSGMAEELAMVSARADQLVEEADPRSTNELLTDYERMCGLPDPCLIGIADEITTAERRASVLARLINVGAQSAQYFEMLAKSIGYPVKVEDFKLHDVDSDVDYPLYAEPWQYAWRVTAPHTLVRELDVMDTVDDPLASWGNLVMECIINRLKPAHTVVIFSYEEAENV